MPGPAFDPSGAVRFDLKSGAASDAGGDRLVLLPKAALEAIGPEALGRLGGALGRACGARAAARLGGAAGVRAGQLEIVVSHLAGELALVGFGAVHIERWGRALVLVVENAVIASDAFVGSVLAAALEGATGTAVFVASLSDAAGSRPEGGRFFVGAEQTVNKVRAMLAQGTPWAEALGAIQKKGMS